MEWTDFNARSYDQQTGRFLQVDPKIESGQESVTPYQFGFDNPARYNDPDGKCPLCALAGAAIGGIIGGGIEIAEQLYSDGKVSDWKAVGGAAAQGVVTGAVAGLTGGASLLTTTLASGAANVAGGLLNRNVIQGKQSTSLDLAADFAVGAASGAASNLIRSNIIAKTLAPQTSGSSFGYTLQEGKVVFQNSMKNSGAFEFVIKDGKVSIGQGHFFMSKGSLVVRGAGEITLKDGVVTAISDNSGHYQPTATQVQSTIKYLQKAGFKFSKNFQTLIRGN